MNVFQQLQKSLNNEVVQNEVLAKYSTFKIGGKADYFFVAKNKNSLIRAVQTAKKLKLPFFILGHGSNVLFSDKGFRGLVIKIEITDYQIQGNEITASAGISLAKLVQIAQKNSLLGLEWAAGIPGTLGGAMYGNAGWTKDKQSIGNIVKQAELFFPKDTIKKVNKSWFKFSYRKSRLQTFTSETKPIVLAVTLKLRKGNFRAIQQAIKQTLLIRTTKIPKEPSCGSFFKNYHFTKSSQFAKPARFMPKEFIKKKSIPAGWLIDKCGLKGKRIGGARISKKHANFIINEKGAKASDVLRLAKLAKNNVFEKFGIELDEEVQLIGDKLSFKIKI